jgi:hypothetical protein
MKYRVVEWTINELLEKQENIHYPVFQREDVWSFKDRALLIDSILMGIDIPKFYLYRIEEEGKDEVNWDCVDGHQRIEAISGYLNGMFQCAGREFSNLSIEEKNTILNYKLTICEILQITDGEIRELFLRLQLGVPLNSGEKLNSMKSKLGDFVKNKLKNTAFIERVNIPSRRYTKEALCAQILNNSKYINTGETRSSKYEDLNLLYKKNSEFDENSETANKIINALSELNEIFGDDAAFIRNRASAVSIYLLVEEMIFNDKPVDKKLIHDFYVEFLKALAEENRKDPLEFRNRNVFLMRYQMLIIQGADARTSIFERHEALKRALDNYKINHEIIYETIDV